MVRAVLKSYRKNILREMKDNLSRMVSLFGIVALGVMMLTGLMSFAPSMRIAGQKYYVQQNVFDLRVLSTLGLSEEDIAAIAAVDGVEAVQPVKYQDVEAQWQGQSETAVVRLQQLPADPGADTAENMNRLVLLSGRMPEAPDECVVHVMGYGDPVEPGTVLTLPEDTEHVSRKQFTVVGTVQDPQHFSTDKESSTAGDGQLDDIVFLPEGSLTTDYYTVCYLKVKNAGLYDNYSDAYQAAVDDTAARVKAISGAQCTARRAEADRGRQCRAGRCPGRVQRQKSRSRPSVCGGRTAAGRCTGTAGQRQSPAGRGRSGACRQQKGPAGYHAGRCGRAGERRGTTAGI